MRSRFLDSLRVFADGTSHQRSQCPRGGFPCRLAVIAVGCVATLFACGGDDEGAGPGTGPDGGVTPTGLLSIVGIDDGDLVTGIISVEAELSQPIDLRGVEFHVNDRRIDTVLSAPYQTSIDTTQIADGSATIAAVGVVDADSTIGDEVSVVVDNTPPVVEIVSEHDTEMFHGGTSLLLRFNVTDTSGIQNFGVTANGIPLTVQGPPWEATFDLPMIGWAPEDLPAELTIRAEATDSVFLQTVERFTFTLRPRLAWKFSTLGEIWAPPAFGAAGDAYFGSRDGVLYAVNSVGSELWRYDTGGEVIFPPAIETHTGSRRIWVATGDRLVVVSDGGTGANSVWSPASTLGTQPVVGSDTVYAGAFNNLLVAVATDSLSTRWTFDAGSPVESAPIELEDGLVAFGADNGRVFGVDSGGVQQWTYQTGDAVWSDAVRASNGDLLIGSHDGYLYRINRYGSKIWEFDARGQIWGGAAEGPNGDVYVGSTYRRVYGLDSDGNEQWQDTVSGLSFATPAVSSDGTVYIAATDGLVHAYARDGSKMWQFATGNEVVGWVALSADESLLTVGANDRHMYALHTGVMSCGPPELITLGDGTRVMRYEASRSDATDEDEGQGTNRVCSRAGVLPWTNVTWQEARAACQSLGLDLCDGSAWELGCQGTGQTDFPYGEPFDAAACNGSNHPAGGGASMPTGENATCMSEAGVFDASGNLREWTLEENGTAYIVRGGGFRDDGDEMRCSNSSPSTHALEPQSRTDDVGFRCCSVSSPTP